MVELETQLSELRVLPVLTVHSVEEAVSLCEALQEGGIKGAEITLRTDIACAAIKAVKNRLPDFIVGAGTVSSCQQIEQLADIGAAFAVSPGLSEVLSDFAFRQNLNYLPGIATATELMQGLSLGRKAFKLFPAESVGGVSLLKSLSAPFSEAQFCPTGGINEKNYGNYLKQGNVICVGGSWMVPAEFVAQKDWPAIVQLARRTVKGVSDPGNNV